VLLGTGACGGSDGPTAASSPSPVSSIDQYRIACDRINTARRDYLDVVLRADLTLDDPNATPAEIHDQADKILAALKTFGTEVLEAGANTTDPALRHAALEYGASSSDIRESIQLVGDDPQKIDAAVNAASIKRLEQRVLDLCRGHYSSPEAGA
jgi:hypothetical protein